MKILAYLFNFFFLSQFAFLNTSIAQTEENDSKDDKEVTIHIKQNVNGEVTESTSTFSLEDLNLEEMMKDLNIELEGLENTLKNELKDLELDIEVEIDGLDDQIKEMKKVIKIEMEDMEEGLLEWKEEFDGEGPHKRVIIKKGNDNKAMLGVMMKKSEEAGVLVGNVVEGSAAEAAGLKSGDVITGINTDVISNGEDLLTAIGKYNPDETIEVTYKRDGVAKTANALLQAPNNEMVFEYKGGEEHVYGPFMGGCDENRMKFHHKMKMHNENKAFLGVIMDESYDGNGVKISEVVEGSAAEKAGLQEGDVLTQVNKQKVGNSDELIEALSPFKAGDQIDIKFERDGKKEKSSAELTSHHEYKMMHSKNKMKFMEDDENVWVEKKAFLGVTTFQQKSSDENEVTEGVTVMNVMPNTAAEEAGIKEGDVIKSVNNVKVENGGQFAELICKNEPGATIDLLVLRDDQPLSLQATLKERSMKMVNCFKSPTSGNSFKYLFDEEGEFDFDLDYEGEEGGVHIMKFKTDDGDEVIKKIIRIKVDADADNAIEEISISEGENLFEEEAAKAELPEMTPSNLPVRNFSFFPNPNEGKFNLKFDLDQSGDTDIRIYDSEGRTVFSEKLKDFSGNYDNNIDISESAKGTYLMQIKQGDKILNEQIVVQ